MSFQFESLAAFVEMGGHGPFVWACYAVTLSAMGYLALRPLLARKSLERQVRRQLRLQQAKR